MQQNELERGLQDLSRRFSTGGGVSWLVIIIMFIVFWPVGVYFLYRKLTVDRVAQLNDGKHLRYGGIGLAVIGAFMLIDGNLGSLFYVIGGIALFVVGNNMKTTSQRFRRYISLVANEQIRDIDVMAGVVGVDYETCAKDLQKMINQGFFHHAMIDHGSKRLIIQERVAEPQQTYAPYAAQSQAQTGPRVAQCPSCGANNTVIGAVAACEYCGSPLS